MLAGCSHIFLFCSKSAEQLFKKLFFSMLSTLEMLLWGHVKKPAKNAQAKLALPKGFCLVLCYLPILVSGRWWTKWTDDVGSWMYSEVLDLFSTSFFLGFPFLDLL